MKFLNIFIPISSLLLLSFEKQDLCDNSYKPREQNGQTICIPDYLTGKTLDPAVVPGS
jgi:hypothetical protein